MVSEVNQNPERNRQAGGQQSPVNSSAPVQNGNGAGIFRIGLTAELARKEGLDNLFAKYDADGDKIISQSEFDTYTKESSNQQQQDITSKSGKRTAVGGVYTVQSGDTLSKIAQDFGLTLIELYEANKDAIGKDPNKINVGLQLKLNLSQVEHEEHHKDVTSETEEHGHSHGEGCCSQEHATAIANFIKLLNTMGIKIQAKDLDEIKEQMQTKPKEQVQGLFNAMLSRYIDMSKADMSLFNGLEDLFARAGMDINEFNNAYMDKKGHLLADALNASLELDLDKENPDSRYNQALKRLKESGLTESEKQRLKKYDFDNLSEKDYDEIATILVTEVHQATVLTIMSKKLKDNESAGAQVFMHGFMESYLSNSNLNNCLMLIANTVGSFSEEELNDLASTYLVSTKTDDTTNAEEQRLVLELALQRGDKESIETFLKNNSHLQKEISEVARYVAENTTDETRKAMLNGIADNSEQIIQGVSETGGGRGGSGVSGGIKGSSVAGNGYVTSPLQMSQIERIDAIRAQSLAFHSQTDPNLEIPEELKPHFQTVQEYQDFKKNAKGMTAAQYRHVNHLIRSNFTFAMNEIIGNYTRLPDKFKPRVLSFFDAMDFNTSSALYLNGNDKLRAFMGKYHYMKPQILSTYVTEHPSELNHAPDEVKQMLNDFREQEQSRFMLNFRQQQQPRFNQELS